MEAKEHIVDYTRWNYANPAGPGEAGYLMRDTHPYVELAPNDTWALPDLAKRLNRGDELQAFATKMRIDLGNVKILVVMDPEFHRESVLECLNRILSMIPKDD
jgi:hypothetical protein